MQAINADALPMLLRVATVVQVSGLSPSKIYRRIATGKLVAKKNRKTTYFVTESLIETIHGMTAYGN
jgi:hypothetical protein